MSESDRLRSMLDERGIEWWIDRAKHTVWKIGDTTWFAKDGCRDGMVELSTILITPEQAIAATLGEQRSTAEITKLLDEFEHECFMLRVEASETRARDDVVRNSYERIRDGFAGRIAATLRSTDEAELQEALNKAAGNWARADERIAALEDLVRDMHGVMWACREGICPHRENGCWRVHAANNGAGEGEGVCWFEERMKELGVM